MDYVRPSSLKEAIDLLTEANGNAVVMAGGSDLLVRMKGGFIEPDLIVDIKAIKGLGEIAQSASGFSIGAAVPCAALGETAALKQAWPGVVEASSLIGSRQVQGRCTIAGNLCNASPAADSVPALVAAGAKAVIVGAEGTRTIAVEDVPTGPGRTSLAKGEIIEAIVLESPPPRSADAYLRFIPRTEMDIAVVGAGVYLTLDDEGRVSSARVALGAVAPTVLLLRAAAEAIIGTKLDASALESLAAVCSAACRPIDDKRGTIEFRKQVAGVLAQRAAKAAYKRAGTR
jgi:aerobic carbon-monoxide dehydrogenase medium subunit